MDVEYKDYHAKGFPILADGDMGIKYCEWSGGFYGLAVVLQ